MAARYKLSDSESYSDEPLNPLPSDKALERGLRDKVAAIFYSGNMEELTVKRVRLAAEKKLGLQEGFFKTTGDWKARSDQIIKDEVVRLQFVGRRANVANNADLRLCVHRKNMKTGHKKRKPSLRKNHLHLHPSLRRRLPSDQKAEAYPSRGSVRRHKLPRRETRNQTDWMTKVKKTSQSPKSERHP
jgi:hypothetical protein